MTVRNRPQPDNTPPAAPEPLPFAHPFFTNAPHARRPTFAGHNRMRDLVRERLEPTPDLSDDPVWTLADVVGAARAAQIEATDAVRFHAVGDTGAGQYPIDRHTHVMHFGELSSGVVDAQLAVARAMNRELDPSLPGWSPAFFFHLGDVVYFDNTPAGFHEQFYVPYQEYGGKIIAIPGNHDAEVLLGHQPSTCFEFMKNFCPPRPTIPPDANPVVREMSAQPGVYWWLQTKRLDLVGLSSNSAEGPGFLRGPFPGTSSTTGSRMFCRALRIPGRTPGARRWSWRRTTRRSRRSCSTLAMRGTRPVTR